ncbi:MAG: Rpp14/Pop5 family protein [Promethearchaeota archaeon]
MPVRLLDRTRYLVIAYLGPNVLTDQQLWTSISRSLLRLYGEQGAARTGLYLIEHDSEKQQAILRATNKSINMVRATLCSIIEINGETILLFVTNVSGTIKGAKKKIIPLNEFIDSFHEENMGDN